MGEETVKRTVEKEETILVCDSCGFAVDHDHGPVEMDLCESCHEEWDKPLPPDTEVIPEAWDHSDQLDPTDTSLRDEIDKAVGIGGLVSLLCISILLAEAFFPVAAVFLAFVTCVVGLWMGVQCKNINEKYKRAKKIDDWN